MAMLPQLSCIILSCDPYILKGNSVLHCLQSVFAQDCENFEVILVENSHKKTQGLALIRDKVASWNKKRTVPVQFTLIDNPSSLSYGKARNIGEKRTKSELLVFLDDDTLLLQNNAFQIISNLSQKFKYGYGAKRIWTKEGWFQQNTKDILRKMEAGETSFFKKHSGDPPLAFQDKQFPETQRHTFIANFGFCKKDIFEKVGGFPDFYGYGFEDDLLMLKLYEGKYDFVSLNTLEVIHVSHTPGVNQQSNLPLYFTELIKRGYYWFHVKNMFLNVSIPCRQIVEPLQTIHYDWRIEKAYQEYSTLLPLGLKTSQQKAVSYWRLNNQFEKIDFSRLMQTLQSSDTLDEFVRRSATDFDNLGANVELGLKYHIVRIQKNGTIRKGFDFCFTQTYSKKEELEPTFIPNSALNQFPCDIASRKRRFTLIKERYPFAEYLRFAIIGDDDFFSLKFVNDFWAWPVVLEKDKRIIRTIKKVSERFQIIEFDIKNITKENNFPEVQTFITDPPYTLHGSLAFILAGLKMLTKNKEQKEFYVILNQTMMGKHLFHIQKILSEASVYLSEVRPNFSHYKLVTNYQEQSRADTLLKQQQIDRKALKYSSSSNLYIFQTLKPNIPWLTKQIDFKKLYQHYL